LKKLLKLVAFEQFHFLEERTNTEIGLNLLHGFVPAGGDTTFTYHKLNGLPPLPGSFF
jgi:hypothetical protein